MKPTTVVLPILALVPGFFAPDYRVLYSRPSWTTMSVFQATWESFCPLYATTHGATWLSNKFEPGDWANKNDTEVARIACIGYDGPLDDPPQFAKQIVLTEGLAEQVGADKVPNGDFRVANGAKHKKERKF
ncbi:hypothetical protein BT69DRAFT_1349902 [Atractiella rhizophila]|nr:hypothetical protein BT69DRAFT_1349902 [Atractiella rhizophila]